MNSHSMYSSATASQFACNRNIFFLKKKGKVGKFKMENKIYKRERERDLHISWVECCLVSIGRKEFLSGIHTLHIYAPSFLTTLSLPELHAFCNFPPFIYIYSPLCYVYILCVFSSNLYLFGAYAQIKWV
jgi:hypothetical protein